MKPSRALPVLLALLWADAVDAQQPRFVPLVESIHPYQRSHCSRTGHLGRDQEPMSYRGWLLAGLLASGGPLNAEEVFPIGAWFPGMIAGESKIPTAEDRRVRGIRLDSVKAAGFNTIHARQGRGELRTSTYNQAWMAEAHERGLKVHLHSWRQPTAWRSHSRNYWTRTFEAEDTERFTQRNRQEGHRWRQSWRGMPMRTWTAPACCWPRGESSHASSQTCCS